MLPPSALECVSVVGGPPIQCWKKHPATRSPTLTLVTPLPISTTSPARSERGKRFGFICIRHIAALMAAVGKLAAALERRFQKRWIKDAFTAEALSVGIERLLFHFGRFEKPKLPPKVKAALTKM